MKLKSIALKNYRGVEYLRVDFSDGVTIVEAPNESGKSSIAEAIRLIRTVPDSSSKKVIQDVAPTHIDAGPEVQLTLESGGVTFEYEKRWKKSPRTRLRLTGLQSGTFTGREAHQKFEELLAATADTNLLDALDVRQGESLLQADLSAAAGLRSVLDQGEDSADDSLLSAAEAEYRKYFGKSGAPVGGYRTLMTEVDASIDVRDELRRRAQEAEDLVRRREELERTGLSLQSRQQEVLDKQERAEAALAALASLRQEAHSARLRMEQAQEVKDRAFEELHLRRKLTEEVEIRRASAAAAAQSERAALAGLTAAKEEEAAAAVKRSESAQRLASAKAALRSAEEQLQAHMRRFVVEDLEGRVRQAKEANKEIAQAKAIIGKAAVSPEAVSRLQELSIQVDVARRALEMAAPELSIDLLQIPSDASGQESEGPRSVILDGQELREKQIRTSVTATRVIEVPGVAQVKVHPGSGAGELQEALKASEQAFDEELRDVGVQSLEQAQAKYAKQMEATASLRTAKASLAQAIGNSDLASLEAELEAAREMIRQNARSDESGIVADGDITADALEAARSAAKAREDAVEQELARAQSALEAASSRVTAAKVQLSGAQATAAGLQTELAAQIANLESAKARVSDEQLATALTVAERQLETAAKDAKVAEDNLAAKEPENLARSASNAKALVERVSGELTDNSRELHRVEGALQASIQSGVADKLAEAEANHEHLGAQLEALRARAEAARMLWQELMRASREAQERYVAPLKAQIDALGASVFGPDFSVDIDPGLKVTARTLNGVTVPFDSLSAGAREQLAILSRLAGAALVDPADGAPVILDDVLGFADPERLGVLSEIIAEVGGRAQVIVLTCQPARFQDIGGAKVVRL